MVGELNFRGALELNYWPRGARERAKTPISEKGLQAIMKRATFALLALVVPGQQQRMLLYRPAVLLGLSRAVRVWQ